VPILYGKMTVTGVNWCVGRARLVRILKPCNHDDYDYQPGGTNRDTNSKNNNTNNNDNNNTRRGRFERFVWFVGPPLRPPAATGTRKIRFVNTRAVTYYFVAVNKTVPLIKQNSYVNTSCARARHLLLETESRVRSARGSFGFPRLHIYIIFIYEKNVCLSRARTKRFKEKTKRLRASPSEDTVRQSARRWRGAR